ncbi:MAG: AAA family ATPase [Rhodothermales bacterium]
MSTKSPDLFLRAAERFVDAGLSIIPCDATGAKRPLGYLLPVDPQTQRHTWKPYQEIRPAPEQLEAWFAPPCQHAIAIIGGRVSGGIEVLDFDEPALWPAFVALCRIHALGLLDRLPRVGTPSGGYHVYYRCRTFEGNQKLAERWKESDVKEHATLIETRGEGGYVLAPPSPGYCMLQGTLTQIPMIEPGERERLLGLARSFNECAGNEAAPSDAGDSSRPGDAFNEQGWDTCRGLLQARGWRLLRTRANGAEEWQRPGKEGQGLSATYGHVPNRFYVFSTNAHPFEPLRTYRPFSVFALLEYGGNFSAAATALTAAGYGEGLVQSEGAGASRMEVREEPSEKPQPVPLWGFEKPPPLRWIVTGFLPKGFITLLAADGGVGKSYLAICLAIMVCLGRPFLGLGTLRGRVLYVDYELDEHEQKRRVWRVLSGLNMTPDDPRLVGRFYYYRPRHALSSEAGHDEVVSIIRQNEISLVILDSLTIGMGADATSQQDVTRIMQRFKDWGTVFAIDHISGLAARGNQSRARPFGSVFKRNIARATFTLARADAGGHLLTSDKNNFGPQQDLLCYAIDFLDEGERVRFRRLDHADEEMAGAMQHMSTYEITLLAIKSIYRDTGEGVSPDAVVQWRGDHDEAGSVKAGTVRNHFTVLKKRGKIELGDGTAVPAVHDFIHDNMNGSPTEPPKQHENGHSRFTVSIGAVNRESSPGGDGVPVDFEFDD